MSDASIPDAAQRFGLPVTEGSLDGELTKLFRVGTLVVVPGKKGDCEFELATRGNLTELEKQTLHDAADRQMTDDPRQRDIGLAA